MTLAAIVIAFGPSAWTKLNAATMYAGTPRPIRFAGLVAGAFLVTTVFVYLPLFEFVRRAKHSVLAVSSLAVSSFLLTTVFVLCHSTYEYYYDSQDAGRDFVIWSTS